MLERADSWLVETKLRFHNQGVFCGLWILVLLVGIHTMQSLRSILEPLIWAFFLMMGLLPLCDLVECVLFRIFAAMPWCCWLGCGSQDEMRAEAAELERQYSGLTFAERSRRSRMVVEASRVEETTNPCEDDEGSEASSSAGISGEDKGICGCVRVIAVSWTIVIFLGFAVCIVGMVYKSASHMQSVWPHYEEGAQRIISRFTDLKQRLPADVADRMAEKTLEAMEGILSFLVSTVFEHISVMLVEILMTLLYMIFWLCQPVFVGEKVTALFKQYILLKTFASSMYGFSIYLLLLGLGVDLAIVFGFIAFLFNFVPEVGTIAAMILPIPVILFDGRLERPLLNLVLALCGQFVLKFIFANIIEVKLVERQNDFRMHPVTILFFVAFFGCVWGATGMLVSVPIVAAAKAASEVMPPLYRDAFLVFLEGDKEAPARFRRRAARA